MAVERTVVDEQQVAAGANPNYAAEAERVMNSASAPADEQSTQGQPAPEAQPSAAPADGTASPKAQPEGGASPATPQQQEQPKPGDPEGPLAQHYVDLMRREGSLTRKEVDLRRREEAVQGKESNLSDLQRLAQENPLQAIEKLGLDYAAVTRFAIEQGRGGGENALHRQMNTEMTRLSEEVQNLKKELESERTGRVAHTLESDAKMALDKNPDWELSQFHGQDAIDFALRVYGAVEQEYGYRPTWQQVYDQVEKHYEDTASRLAQLPKVRSSLNPPGSQQPSPNDSTQQPPAPQAGAPQPAAAAGTPPAQQAPPQTPPQAQAQPGTVAQPQAAAPTLSNEMNANAGVRAPTGVLSDDELRRQAMELMERAEKG